MIKFLQPLLHMFSRDIAMDLGTANSLLFTRSGGIVVNEPSIVALDALSNAVLAVGSEAKKAHGRTPNRIRTVRPLKDGVIADFDVTNRMMIRFISDAIGKSRFVRPSMFIGIPTGITQVEKKAVVDAAHAAGAAGVRLIEEPMAAAIGAGLPVEEPRGTFIADIGGGTSEVAVISLSSIAVSRSLRTAGDAMNECVHRMLREVYRLETGENTSERVKMTIGAAIELPELEPMPVSGKDMVTGVPKTVMVTPESVREALKEPVDSILNVILHTLEKTPPELAADIFETGLCLTGGGALLKGLDTRISQEIKLPVIIPDDPLLSVLKGASAVMNDVRRYKDVFAD